MDSIPESEGHSHLESKPVWSLVAASAVPPLQKIANLHLIELLAIRTHNLIQTSEKGLGYRWFVPNETARFLEVIIDRPSTDLGLPEKRSWQSHASFH